MGRVLTVLHTSDWQCGRPYLPEAADALVRLADRVEPDVVVAAGDLTQRAKAREYRLAMDLAARLPRVPFIATPGNHDVPLYRFWERLLAPFGKWRRFVSEDLDTVTSVDGATFVALSSAAPRRAIVNGRIRPRQWSFALDAFERTPEGDLRCLVVHHHFVPTQDEEGGPPLPGAADWLGRFEAAGVDIVFGGHVHHTHVTISGDVLGRAGCGVPIVASGTATSRRGRGSEAGWNSVNVVRLSTEQVEVQPYRRAPEATDFEPTGARVFPTSGAGEGVPR